MYASSTAITLHSSADKQCVSVQLKTLDYKLHRNQEPSTSASVLIQNSWKTPHLPSQNWQRLSATVEADMGRAQDARKFKFHSKEKQKPSWNQIIRQAIQVWNPEQATVGHVIVSCFCFLPSTEAPTISVSLSPTSICLCPLSHHTGND